MFLVKRSHVQGGIVSSWRTILLVLLVEYCVLRCCEASTQQLRMAESKNNDELTFGISPLASSSSASSVVVDDMIVDDNDDDDDDDMNDDMDDHGGGTQSGGSSSSGSQSSAQSGATGTGSAAGAGGLTQKHASQFKTWLEVKSTELFSMTRNYSGFQLLNHTYNVRLPKESNFSWINFTDMIVNISKSISEVYDLFLTLLQCMSIAITV